LHAAYKGRLKKSSHMKRRWLRVTPFKPWAGTRSPTPLVKKHRICTITPPYKESANGTSWAV